MDAMRRAAAADKETERRPRWQPASQWKWQERWRRPTFGCDDRHSDGEAERQIETVLVFVVVVEW